MFIINRIFNKGFSILEKFFAQNWFNPLTTFWINFRSLPFLQAVKLPIWTYGRPKLMCLSGKIVIKAPVKSGMIRFNYINIGSPSNMGVQSEINNAGTIIFKGSAKLRTGNRIVVGYGAILEIGNKLILGDMINIGCFKHIRIGDNVRIAHRSQIFDSNYHYVANLNKHIVPTLMRPISIGSYSWICNSASISAGAVIPPYTIVSTNSLVNKDFSSITEKSILGGIPAKLLSTGFCLVNNLNKEREIASFYVETPENASYVIPDKINPIEWFEQV